MGVKLYCINSPPNLFVFLTLEALGNVNCEKQWINALRGEQRSTSYKKINPEGKMPTLVDDDVTIAQSASIAIYLCSKFGPTSDSKDLYPEGITERAKVDQMLFLNLEFNNTISAYVNNYGIVFRKETFHCEEYKPEVLKLFDSYNRILGDHKYLVGDKLTIADFQALAANFLLLKIVKEFKEWENYPNITRWLQDLAKLPFYKEAYKKGEESMLKLFKIVMARNRVLSCNII